MIIALKHDADEDEVRRFIAALEKQGVQVD
jgi:hypothetical protein